MGIVKTQGLVLKETNVGEADKILTIFTRKEGKLQASARGVRNPKSRLIAGSQFLCYSDFVLYKGKEIYRISESEVIENFFNIRNSIEKLAYAAYFTELTSEVIVEDISNQKLLKLILNTLHILSTTERNPALLKVIYQLRLMSLIGYTPNLVNCTRCSLNSEAYHFHSEMGGILCDRCAQELLGRKFHILSPGALQGLRYIIYSQLKDLFSFDLSPQVMKEIERIIDHFVSVHVGKELKTKKYLDSMLKSI